ncbi:MAG: hypothetical protein K1X63_11210 [Chitinophagales bacterium]|nr:hypothetical protein [Chitinophagales bacterium]
MFSPYKNEALNLLYNLLYCDDINLFRENSEVTDAETYPWYVLFDPQARKDDLEIIVNDHTHGSRVRLLAANRLREMQVKPSLKELLGVVIEVALPEGLDVLAGYNDQTARYINYSEKVVIWETADPASLPLFVNLMNEGAIVVNKIGPWEKPRLPFPEQGNTRVTFQVTDGIYFGQAATNVLFKDPMASPVLNAGLALMKFLTEASQEKQ